MVTLTINGKMVQAKDGEMLLAVIKRMGIDIPSTCHHDAVEPYGGCRLCTVEITRKDWNGWKNHVTSCLYPAEEGLIVSTHSPEVIELRRTILDLFLARCPNAELIRKMAADHGIDQTSFETVPDGNDCILCGLCTRICDQMGFHAISMVGRGHGREVAPPLFEPPPSCVGCIACAEICPTNYIKYEDKGKKRKIWGKEFELLGCKKTGRPTITRDFAEYLTKNRQIPAEYYELGDDTHRDELAVTMGKLSAWDREEK